MKTEKTQYPSRAVRQSKAHEALQRAKERERELERRGLLRRIEIGGTIVVGTAASTAELARRLGADSQQSEARPSQRELEGREPWLWCGCYWRSASSIAQELGILTQTATRHARALGLELHRDSKTQRIDLSRDLMAQIYEQELAQRKENKQDFTPSSVSILASRLAGTCGSVHEPTAGNGGMLIPHWHEMLMSAKSFEACRPSKHPIEAWELSDRSLPILLLNLSLRGIMGMVVHGDVLEYRAEALYLLENPTDDPLAFSTVRKITRENFAEFAREQMKLRETSRGQTDPQATKTQSGQTPEYTIEYLDLWNSKEQHSEK